MASLKGPSFNIPDDLLEESANPPVIRGEIKVGSSWQAEVPQGTLETLGKTDDRVMEDLETLVYRPNHGLTDKEIEQYLTIAKSVGTFARALDHSSSIKQPSIHMSAAAASRDITIAHAMNVLHQNNYDIGKAVLNLVPLTGPVLCRDEMEEWSAAEANLFEEALDKYGKDFNEIKQDFLSWKSMKNIVEYYYMWKTTDRYLQQKRIKVAEAENRARQLYISNYNQKQSSLDGNETVDNLVTTAKSCATCHKTSSTQWYPWGAPQQSNRICQSCWLHWKKYGELRNQAKLAVPEADRNNSSYRIADQVPQPSFPCRECDKVFSRQERLIAHLVVHQNHRCAVTGCNKEFKFKTQLARHCAQAHGIAIRAGSPRPIMKTRAAFYLQTTPAAKLARRLCSQILKIKHAARAPFSPLNVTLVKQECQIKLAEGATSNIPNFKPINRGKVVDISQRLGTPQMDCPEWLIITPKDQIPVPERLAFPPPEKGKDGQYIIRRSVEPSNADGSESVPSSMYKNLASRGIDNNLSTNVRKRTHDQHNGGSGGNSTVQLKRRNIAPPVISKQPTSADIYGVAGMPRGASIPGLNGRPKVATITRVGGGRKQMISWVDAPDDVYFVATESTRRLRKQINLTELRKGARRPWRRLFVKNLTNAISNNNRGHNLPGLPNQEPMGLTMIE